jgi:hypothetical protein
MIIFSISSVNNLRNGGESKCSFATPAQTKRNGRKVGQKVMGNARYAEKPQFATTYPARICHSPTRKKKKADKYTTAVIMHRCRFLF